MKTLKIYLFSCIALAMASCGGDGEPAVTVPQQFQISHITVTNVSANLVLDQIDFGYDASNRVSNQNSTNESNTFEWSSTGKINRMISAPGNYETLYVYDATGQLTSQQRKQISSGIVQNRYEYTYFSDRYEQRYFNTENELVWYYKFFFSTDHRNIARAEQYYGTGELVYTTDYTYDDKIGVNQVQPYTQLPLPFRNANNVVTETSRDANGIIVRTTETQYGYDALGHVQSSTDEGVEMAYEYLVK